ncbi:MAG TPA: hypothetical protein VFN91_13650 [Myxococcaceae bacterium]|nr:hypothetical protein [Myxococcaceae bacterium]
MRHPIPVDETRAAARRLALLAALALLGMVGVHRLAESTPVPWNAVPGMDGPGELP